MKNKIKKEIGITLLALVITIIVLLILVGISLSGVLSKEGLFQKTKNASNRYNETKAREVLETVLLGTAQYEKRENSNYDEEGFLDELIKREIPGSNVKGDTAIIGEYAFELDRSVPKIGTGGNNGYLGKESDLVFPTVTVTEPVIASDYRSASFTITASEEKTGINKIEVWVLGEMVKEYKYTDGAKTPRTETYTANRNGVYTIKAYANIMANGRTKVTGIVPAVEFSPNGSDEWKKEHSTKITLKETGEKVKSLKYKWTKSVNPPTETEFTEECTNNSTIVGKDVTGTYYLWVLVELDTNPVKINICGSEGFNFDNEAPDIALEFGDYTEDNGILTVDLNLTMSDLGGGLANYSVDIKSR